MFTFKTLHTCTRASHISFYAVKRKKYIQDTCSQHFISNNNKNIESRFNNANYIAKILSYFNFKH